MGEIDRMTRVNALLKRELAELMERDAMLPAGVLLSVTSVRTSVDLRNAIVFVSIFGADDKGKGGIIRSLNALKVAWQKKIAHSLSFKHTPVLEFRIDGKLEAADRVLDIINEAEKAEQNDEQ